MPGEARGGCESLPSRRIFSLIDDSGEKGALPEMLALRQGGPLRFVPPLLIREKMRQQPSEPNCEVAIESEVRTALPEQTVESMAALLRVLADPTRIRLIEILEDRGRATVSSLTASLPISQQSVSRQLGVLFQAGIVGRRREGIWVQYELRDWSGPWVLRQLSEGLSADRARR